MPVFTENLRGASPDDVREFEVTYPDDYERKQLAGRTVKFRATVKAVRRKELPELNDEFAKDLGDFKTLEELKETIRKNILREREQRAQEDAKHQLIDKLVDAHDFAVPEAYIDRQIRDQRRKPIARRWRRKGMDPKGLKLDWEKVRQSRKGPRRAGREGGAPAGQDRRARSRRRDAGRGRSRSAAHRPPAARSGGRDPREAPERRRHRPHRGEYPDGEDAQFPV